MRLKVLFRNKAVRWYCFMLVALWGATPAYAAPNDAMLERDGMRCVEQISRAERKYGIPAKLLHAIAATETGRKHQATGRKIPWPWSVNVEGRPYLYSTKLEAVRAVEAFQKEGRTSIDVGCMQVNLRHHPTAFANVSQAFEPSYNVDYAARFLRSNYDETKVWRDAVGKYHSRTPGYAARYIGVVYQHWGKFAQDRAVAVRSPQTASKYTSYIRNETTGAKANLHRGEKRVVLAALDKKPQSSEHVVRPQQKKASKAHEINIIRVPKPVVRIETAPTQDVASQQSSVISVAAQEKGFTNRAGGSNPYEGMAENVQFIRFVE